MELIETIHNKKLLQFYSKKRKKKKLNKQNQGLKSPMLAKVPETFDSSSVVALQNNLFSILKSLEANYIMDLV